jgi:hypothetical protein
MLAGEASRPRRIRGPMRKRSRFIRSFAAILVAVALFACTKSPEQKIIGKWRLGEDQTIEFFPDKTLVLGTEIKNFSGVYSFVSDDRIKVEFGGLIIGLAGPQIARVSFQDDALVLDGDSNSNLFSGHHVLKRIGG